MYGWLSRCSTARGSSSGLSQGGPTKVKARKSFLFTEFSIKVENKEHFFDFVVTLFIGKRYNFPSTQARVSIKGSKYKKKKG